MTLGRLALLLVIAASAFVVLSRRGTDRGGAPRPAPAAAGAPPDAARPARLDPANPEVGASPRTSAAADDSATAAVPSASALVREQDALEKGAELVQCVLYGRVTGEEGPLASRWRPFVSVTDAAGERRNTDVDERGNYSLAGLAPGDWRIDVGGVLYRDQRAALTLIAGAPFVRRDFVLQSAVALPVRVLTSSGANLREALAESGTVCPPDLFPFAVATLTEPGASIPEAADHGSDRIGAGSFWSSGPLWDANPDSIGVLVLAVDLPVFVSLLVGTRVTATQRVEPGAAEVVFVLDPGEVLQASCTLRVRYIAADDGKPLGGWLRIEPLNTALSSESAQWEQTLPPGRHTLSFHARGYACIPQAIELAPGEVLDLGDVVLPRELTVEGRVVDADGKPVASELTLGRRTADGDLTFDETFAYRTEPDGAFKITGLLPGHYVLRTVGDDEVTYPGRNDPATTWVSGNVPVSSLGGSVNGLEVRLVKAGRLVLQNAMDSGAAGCRILDEHGDVLRRHRFDPGFVPRFAIPPGPYTVVLLDEERNELQRRPIEVGPELTELDLAR